MRAFSKRDFGLALLFFCLILSSCDNKDNLPLATLIMPTDNQSNVIIPTESPVPVSYGVLSVWEAYRAIEGWDWPANTGVNVVINSNDGTQKENLSVTTTDDGQFPRTEFDSSLEDGDQIIIDMENSQLLLPVKLVLVLLDPLKNTVSGSTEPNVRVTITLDYPSGSYTDLETISDNEGNFVFDLSPVAEFDYHRHFWISHFYNPHIHTSITNNSSQIKIKTQTYDSTFISKRLNIPNLSNSGHGNILMDFDSDGDLDLILINLIGLHHKISRPILAFRNDGLGNFAFLSNTEIFGGLAPSTYSARHWAINDFNGDGLKDLFIADHGPDHDPFPGGQSLLLMQNEKGQLIDETSSRIPQKLAFTHHVSAGDIDLDGDIDIYMCNYGSTPGAAIYLNDGNGYFLEDPTRLPSNLSSGNWFYLTSQFIDVDIDGDLDLFLGTDRYDRDAMLINDGNGNFSYAPFENLPLRLGGRDNMTVSIASADFNRDGWPDLALSNNTNYSGNVNIQLLINNGDSTFRDETHLINQDWEKNQKPGCEMQWGDGWIVWLFIVDPNNDGWPDLIAQGASCINSLLFTNNQGENFTVTENYNEVGREDLFSTHYLWALLPGDVDGDSDLDVILFFTGVEQLVALRE